MSSLERPSHWRSLDELARTPDARESAQREFAEPLPAPVASRRRFLQLAAASAALSSAGCNNPTWPWWPKAKILPYAYRPDGQVEGTPLYFATCMQLGGVARPLLVKSYDGRPIKIEGNPDHPMSRGAADLWAQASIYGMYDPDRSQGPARFAAGAETEATFDAFGSAFGTVLAGLRATQGEGLRVLSEPSSSATLVAARARLCAAFPNAAWHEWDPLSRDSAREGARIAFGRPLRARYRLEECDVVVSLDDDLLQDHPAALAHSRAFAARRRVDEPTMLRLYAVESSLSVTGTNADVRVPVPSSAVPSVAAALAARLARAGVGLPASVAGLAASAADVPELHRKALDAIARDLVEHRGRGLIAVGPAQPPALHALAHALNLALGNTATLDWTEDDEPGRGNHADSIRDLAAAMASGSVQALIILGGNPVYDAPADVDFAAALRHVKDSAHLSLHRDETSRACSWHVPRAHDLEAWDAARAWDGTWTIAQPLIQPLYGGCSVAELLSALVDPTPRGGEELVREALAARLPAIDWRRAVHDGFVAGSDAPATTVALSAGWSAQAEDFALPSRSAPEITFRADLKLRDGQLANNPWLQELPDPVTKLTWDNAALVGPSTALEMGLREGDLLRVTRGPRSFEIPVYLMPGQAPGSIMITLGHGRENAGAVIERESYGKGGGFDAYAVRTSDALWTAVDAQIEKTRRRYALAHTQGHHAIHGVENAMSIQGQGERLPQLVREATIEHYREHPDFAKHTVHHPPLRSLWKEHSYDTGAKWGMAIDLTSCTGCGACVVACQAENNISTVGKAEVQRGREMHWIRIDRYFSGDEANPAVAHQPVVCQQCENAPCEQVCPVAATTHSSEGLNDMVYNRCIGTRYCSNNCPYKVRRFNWFNNIADQPEILKMQRNPDVTVRSRGVMEKCTYCVQRIKAVTIPARNDGRKVEDGEIVPACAQTCPTNAIVFGDLNDPDSRVRHLHDHARSYAMLEELNVKPRTHYLAKIRNPGQLAARQAEAPHGAHDATEGGHGA